MRSGTDAPAVCVGNPATGVRTSGTTSASGGIFGKESFLGPPHAEHDNATGVFTKVQRGHAHSNDPSPHIDTSPLDSAHRDSPLATCPLTSGLEAGSTGVGGGCLGGMGPLAVTGAAPHTEHEPNPW